MKAPRMIDADVPGRGRMYYLVDEALNFVPEVKDFFDWKAATKRAPATVKAYCARLAHGMRNETCTRLKWLANLLHTCSGFL